MKKFVGIVEHYLIRIIVLSLVAMVLVQGLMTQEPLRFYLSWAERLEGESIEYPVASNPSLDEPAAESVPSPQPVSPQAQVVLVIDKFSALPQAYVLVNGIKYGNFEGDQLVLDLMAGDVVEIDSTYYNMEIDYSIKSISDNVSFPETGTVYTANQSIVMLGKVIVK